VFGGPICAAPCLHDSAISFDFLRRSSEVLAVGGEASSSPAFDAGWRAGEFGVLLLVHIGFKHFMRVRVQKNFVSDRLRFH
jgi:hypothetical protein